MKRLPPAPAGWKWLRACQTIKRGDRYCFNGELSAVTRGDIGTKARAPLWFETFHGFCHYLRRKSK